MWLLFPVDVAPWAMSPRAIVCGDRCASGTHFARRLWLNLLNRPWRVGALAQPRTVTRRTATSSIDGESIMAATTQESMARPCGLGAQAARHAGRTATVNVGETERWWSAVGGGALAALGLTRCSLRGLALAALGAALAYRGVTGHCACYEALGINTAEGSRRAEPAAVPRHRPGHDLHHGNSLPRPLDVVQEAAAESSPAS